MSIIRLVLLSVGLFLSCASLAEAHAFLDRAEPTVGSTVQHSPAELKLWFTRHIKPVASTVKVFSIDNQEVDKHDGRIDPTDPTLLTVSLTALAPGAYQAVWTAVCFDGHTTHGSFTFSVGKP